MTERPDEVHEEARLNEVLRELPLLDDLFLGMQAMNVDLVEVPAPSSTPATRREVFAASSSKADCPTAARTRTPSTLLVQGRSERTALPEGVVMTVSGALESVSPSQRRPRAVGAAGAVDNTEVCSMSSATSKHGGRPGSKFNSTEVDGVVFNVSLRRAVTYCIRYYDELHKRRTVVVGPDFEQTKVRLVEMTVAASMGESTSNVNITLNKVVDEWRGVRVYTKEATPEAYDFALNTHVLPYLGNM